MTDDAELLRQYAQSGSETAFADLVGRYLPLVYTAALRRVGGEEDLAKDVAQTVFIDLAGKASSLLGRDLLAGWLYTSARLAASKAVRGEQRRQRREQIAVSMQERTTEPESPQDQTELKLVLDDAMGELGPGERNAVLLRYFQGSELKEVGAALGISEDAARMRVTRALGKLEVLLKRRGVTISAAALGTALVTEASVAVPAGLAASISAAAGTLAGTATAAATASATKVITMSILPKTLIIATLAATAGTGIYEARQASRLREQVQTLQQHQTPLAAQIRQLTGERDEATRQLDALREHNERLSHDAGELLKLRAEVTRLRGDLQSARETKAPTLQEGSGSVESLAKTWLAKVNQLRLSIEQTPDAKIPELQFLTENNWLDAAKGSLDTEDDRRKAMQYLVGAAKNNFVALAQTALNKYADGNNGQFPAEVSELGQYFASPMDKSVLDRYQVVSLSSMPDLAQTFNELRGNFAIAEKSRAYGGEMIMFSKTGFVTFGKRFP